MRFLLSTFLILAPAIAQAAEVNHAYTKLEDSNCRTTAEYEAGASSMCQGFGGVWFEVNDGDARISVSFGVDPEKDPQDRRFESFSSFNNINNVIEWRYREDVDGGRPFATILRWFVSFSHDGMTHKDGQILVVSQVGDGEIPGCVVGYVDALVNKDANQLARNVADTVAPNFVCGEDAPEYYGETGRLSGNPMRPSE
jgi:hypothetical protein